MEVGSDIRITSVSTGVEAVVLRLFDRTVPSPDFLVGGLVKPGKLAIKL